MSYRRRWSESGRGSDETRDKPTLHANSPAKTPSAHLPVSPFTLTTLATFKYIPVTCNHLGTGFFATAIEMFPEPRVDVEEMEPSEGSGGKEETLHLVRLKRRGEDAGAGNWSVCWGHRIVSEPS